MLAFNALVVAWAHFVFVVSGNAWLRGQDVTSEYSLRSVGTLRIDGKWALHETGYGWRLVPKQARSSRFTIVYPPEFGVRSLGCEVKIAGAVLVDLCVYEKVFVSSENPDAISKYEDILKTARELMDVKDTRVKPVSSRGQALDGLLRLCRAVLEFVSTYARGPKNMTELVEFASSRGLLSSQSILDPWGREVLFRDVQSDTSRTYEFVSFGKDGKAGGDGDDSDVTVVMCDR